MTPSDEETETESHPYPCEICGRKPPSSNLLVGICWIVSHSLVAHPKEMLDYGDPAAETDVDLKPRTYAVLHSLLFLAFTAAAVYLHTSEYPWYITGLLVWFSAGTLWELCRLGYYTYYREDMAYSVDDF